MKKKKPTVGKTKEKAWGWFSKFIRLRDCIITTHTDEEGLCVTCQCRFPLKKLQAGHFIPGRRKGVLFSEVGVHAQCLTKESNIRMFNGINKPINKLVVGDRLWAFNEKSYDLEYSVVKRAVSFVSDDLYEIELEDGSVFKATGDHMVVSRGVWVRIDEMLHDVSANDILEL